MKVSLSVGRWQDKICVVSAIGKSMRVGGSDIDILHAHLLTELAAQRFPLSTGTKE